MWKAILMPTKSTSILWANALFLLLLLAFNLAAPLTIVFAYFLETIIIGIIHLVKLWLVSKYGQKSTDPNNQLSGIPLMLFFTVHYGMFVAIQSIFAFSLFQGSVPGLKDGFDILYNYKFILGYEGMQLILASIILNNVIYFFTNFWQNEKYREYSPDRIFMKPYLRIFIQQFVVILAFFFFIIFNSGMIAAVLLIFFRLFLDLVLFSIKKDSRMLEILTKKISKSPDQYAEVSKQLQEYSE
ncbi:hypothetical protein Aeqsu_1821 [Aequorivita sublithincola DSM 14238]|uniref:Uncharacterized protein n=1 Tax=Aequorivita sublithincola (strain DSM 14238 / LMG 21431 / ACAM 643 / 9-3) TaxID=746697 RepID=I3YWD2_AEQSU|nr:DUF6498-containing protein [Aequorivita sublithincola]AFL81300.1 hypothetical protein Aeqsu_1821 [Aequorivita sublithincola DSM 14238]